MKKLIFVFGMLFFSTQNFAQNQNSKQSTTSNEIKVPLSPENWEFTEGKLEFFEKNSIKFMRIKQGNQGAVSPKNIIFDNGIIEFDFEPAAPMTLGSSPSVYFRGNKQDNNTEIFYIRARPNQPTANDAIQYAPILGGVNMWDMYPEYQSPAFFEADKSNHLKIIINGSQMQVFVNDMSKPALHIPKLEGKLKEGMVAFDGGVLISNLFIRPQIVENLPAVEAPDLSNHEANYIRLWSCTVPQELPLGQEVVAQNLPKKEGFVENILAERKGMINLTRKFGGNSSRKMVYLKVKINAKEAQTNTLQLGFSDEVWVFINGQMVYLDKNIYLQPAMRKYPQGRISIQNSRFNLPLQKGENELIIAVANDFYGWGIIARLDNMEGITVE